MKSQQRYRLRRERRAAALGMLIAGVLVATAAAASRDAAAQSTYPSRPIAMSAGFAPGGPTDTVARAIGQRLGAILGQPVVVENRPGADGRIQLQHLANASPEGYQIGLADSGLTVNATLYKTPPYDVFKDFTPITFIGEMPNFIAVTPGLNVHSLREFLDYARSRPGKLNYGATASSTILATELLTDTARLSIERVRYKGAAAAIPALASGEIQVMVSAAGTLAPMVRQGRIRALAVTSGRRTPLIPDIPTTAEAGLPEYVFVNWYAVVGPANMPKPVVDRLNAALHKVLAEPEVVAQLERMGVTVEPASGTRLAEILKADVQKLEQIVAKANLKIE